MIFLFLLILVFLAIILYCWYRLRKEVHVRSTGYDDTPKSKGFDYTSFSVKTMDALSISGWYIPVKNPKAFVILLHGRVLENGGKAMMLAHAEYLHKEGYASLLFDMRAVGESEGNKTTFGVDEWKDALAVYTYAKNLPESKGKRIGFLGISMGGAAAIIASGKEHIGDFVIASVPYASYVSLFRQQVKTSNFFPTFIFTWGLSIAALFEMGLFYMLYTPIRFIRQIHVPVFLISAKKDILVDPEDPWKLYNAANKPKEYWEADSPHHVHGSMKEEFEKRILEFLDRYSSS